MNRSGRGWTRYWISIRMKERASSDDLIPEEFGGPPSLVPDNQAFLLASLDLKYLHHRAITRLDVPENLLIDFEGVIRRLLEEDGIGNSPDIGLSAKRLW